MKAPTDAAAAHAMLLSSLTPHTGNAVTSARIAAALPVAHVTSVDVASVRTPQELAPHLASCGASVVVGVHAYRAGRALLGCRVPYVLVLGGTDINEHLHEDSKRDTILAAVAQAVVAAAEAGVAAGTREGGPIAAEQQPPQRKRSSSSSSAAGVFTV